MLVRDGLRVAIVLCVLLGPSWAAEAQELNADGDVTGLALEASGGGPSEVLPAWGGKTEAAAVR